MKIKYPIIEKDANGNEIHFKDSNGFEYWKTYDDNGNMIHFKNSKGYESWTKYDENRNPIHFKDSDGVERWYEYNADGRLIKLTKKTVEIYT